MIHFISYCEEDLDGLFEQQGRFQPVGMLHMCIRIQMWEQESLGLSKSPHAVAA